MRNRLSQLLSIAAICLMITACGKDESGDVSTVSITAESDKTYTSSLYIKSKTGEYTTTDIQSSILNINKSYPVLPGDSVYWQLRHYKTGRLKYQLKLGDMIISTKMVTPAAQSELAVEYIETYVPIK